MVMAGLKSIKDRKQEAQKLLDWGFRQFKTVNAYSAGDRVGQARVWGGVANWVELVTQEDVRLMLSPDEQASLEVQLHYSGPLMAPVKSGQKVGFVRFASAGQPIAEVPVLTASEVEATQSMWQRAFDSVLIMAFGG
jgi:D-alanyl-D-alanine carboxypeptidase (penicillin-binding protein 5/6)